VEHHEIGGEPESGVVEGPDEQRRTTRVEERSSRGRSVLEHATLRRAGRRARTSTSTREGGGPARRAMPVDGNTSGTDRDVQPSSESDGCVASS
jgi:hypothetical protein